MTETTGQYRTPKASQYLQQLCKHFSHKTEAEWTPEAGYVVLSAGTVRLEAGPDMLLARFDAADDETRARLCDVVDKHLVRFAFREGFEHMDWTGVPAG